MTAPLVYRLPELMRALHLGKTTIYEMIKDEGFPQPVRLTARAVGWRVDEVRDWLATRPRSGHSPGRDVSA